MFFVAFVLDSLCHRRRWQSYELINFPTTVNSRFDYIIDVFRHSVRVFFESASVLGIAVLVASIYITVKTANYRNEKRQGDLPYLFTDFYDNKLALLASIFSVLPVVVLSLMHDQGARRKWQRGTLLVIVYILCVALTFLAPQAEWDDTTLGGQPILCDQRGGETYRNGLGTIEGLCIAIPVTWMLVTIAVKNPLGNDFLGKFRFLHVLRQYWSKITGLVAIVVMWIFLGIFLSTRDTIIRANGGASNITDLSFGQVLALFAWAPVTLSLGYHICCKCHCWLTKMSQRGGVGR
jgi:hypothetical protein